MKGLMETFFLIFDNFLNKFSLILYFWIVILHNLANYRYQFKHKWTINIDLLRIANSTTQQAAQYIAASFIRRQCSITNRKSNRPDMVGNYFKSDILFFVHTVT